MKKIMLVVFLLVGMNIFSQNITSGSITNHLNNGNVNTETIKFNVQRIVEYKLVSSTNIEDFERMVNGLISSGYQPFGNIQLAYATLGSIQRYNQVMVRYSER